MDTFLPSKPKSYWGVLKASTALYNASFKHVALISLIISLVIFSPRIISVFLGKDIVADIQPLSPNNFWFFIIDIISMFFFIALIWGIYCVARGRHEPFIEDFTVGAKKVLYAFIATLIQGVLLIIVSAIIIEFIFLFRYLELSFNTLSGFLIAYLVCASQLFLILYVFTLFVFYVPLIAIENRGILDSLKRSAYLVWNHWWRTFSILIVPWVAYLIALIIVKFAFNVNIHIYLLERSLPTITTTVIHILLFALFIPWVGSILLVQLKDLELRKHITSQL